MAGLTFRSSPSVHTGFELTSSLLAGVVGIIALVRYYSRQHLRYLFLATGFLGAALFDAFHTITSSVHFVDAAVSDLPAVAGWGWFAGRTFLGVLLVLAWWTPVHLKTQTGRVEGLVFLGSGAVAAVAFAIILGFPLPNPYHTGAVITRPYELISGALFLVAAVGLYLRKGWRTDTFQHWLVLSLIVEVAAQTVFMPFVPGPFTAQFVFAHILKIIAYTLTLIGLVASMYDLYSSAEHGQRELRALNERLSQAVARRTEAEAELGAQKAQVETVLDNMAEGVLFMDPAGYIVHANASVERILGKEVSRGPPDSWLAAVEVFHEDGKTPVLNEERPAIRALRGETIREMGIWLTTPARPDRFHMQVNAQPVRGDDGAIEGVVVVFRDDTEAHRAHAQARERQERLNAIFRTAQDAIVTIDADSTILEFNPAAEELFGHRAEDVIGAPVTRLMPERFRPAHLDGMDRFLATGKGKLIGDTVELAALHRDGHELPVELSLGVSYGRNGPRFTGVLRNITERADAERRLRESESRYRLLAENASDLIVIHGPAGTVRYASPATLPLTGYSVEEVVGNDLYRFLHPDDRVRLRRRHENVVSEAESSRDTVRFIHKDGHTIWLECVMRWMSSDTDDGDQILATYRDVTDRVQDRNALARSNEELQEFAFIASHDLKEPLRKVIAFGERLQAQHSEALDPRGVDYLDRMRSAAERMRTLLEDLLAYSRVTTRAEPYTQVDLGELMKDVLEDLSEQLEETNGQVDVGQLPMVEADATQMRQALQNLVSNALKYHKAEEPPRVEVRGGTENGTAWFSVSDNGIGIDMRFAERIFRPFQRLHGRSEYSGSGMGLAIVRKIAERHGGSVRLESEPGVGSTFTFCLQRSPENEESPHGTNQEVEHHARR